MATDCLTSGVPAGASGNFNEVSRLSRRSLLAGSIALSAVASVSVSAQAPSRWMGLLSDYRAAASEREDYESRIYTPVMDRRPKVADLSMRIGTDYRTGEPLIHRFHPLDFEEAEPFTLGKYWRVARERWAASKAEIRDYDRLNDTDAVELRFDTLCLVQHEAALRLMIEPAPDAAALATKLQMILDDPQSYAGVATVDSALRSDAKRFGGMA